MTQYRKATIVMDCIEKWDASPTVMVEAVCDENLERSFQLIQSRPDITKEEFLAEMGIEEN